VIEIKNLCKSYGGVTVYENFNLSLQEGQITCILGESGSGKTTLLNCIAGLTGFVGEIPKLKCSYIFQTPRLVPNLTVLKNLLLVCRDEKRAKSMLEKVRLADKANAYPVTLSGGQAQRASIARAFLCDSEIILMDEPFSSLDLKLKAEMTELFFEMWRQDNRTALFVTHDIDEAAAVAGRVIVINKGNAVFDLTPQAPVPRSENDCGILRKKLIEALMNG